MKKTLKFTVLFTIAVVALFALTLLGASAATHASDADAIAAGNIVKIEYTKGGVSTTEYYNGISAAVTAAGDAIADGATITVLGDIAADAATTISAGKVTVNGGGHTATELALTVSGADVVLNGLSIQNSTTMAITLAGGSLEINGTADAPVSVIATKTTKYAIHVSAASTSLKINYANIQGPTAIWLDKTLSEGTEISNSTVKAVAAGTSDYAFAFYTAVENALVATNCTFQTVVDDNISPSTSAGVGDIKGKAVMRNDRACTWTLTDVKIIGTKYTYYTTKVVTQLVNGFQVSGNLTIKTGNYTTASVYMETAQHMFFVMTGKTLILEGDSERDVKVAHTYNGYYAPINLQGTSKLTMNYAYVSGLVQPIYVAGAVTINATNSTVYCGGKQNHNGTLYYEGSASTNTVATFTNCTLTSDGYGIEFVTGSKTHTINFVNTSLTSVKQAFRTHGTGITATINGGNIKGNTAVIVFDKADTTYTLNNVNITGGTLGAISITATGTKLTINGGSHISENTAALYNITNGATVTINGGYFKTTAADLIAVQGSASLTVYGGYFYRPVSADSCSFIRVAVGTANVYGGTFVADYTDVGTVFMLSDTAAVLNAAAFNGYGSASIIYDATTGLPTMEQTESFSFNHNTVEIRGNISLRLDATGDISKSGLRFTSYITAELLSMIESQKDADTAVSYGTVIVPTKYLAAVDYFSIESVQNALVIPATEKGMLTDELGGIFIRASIYNLPHTSTGSAMTYADAYAFIAYAEYTVEGKTVRHYSVFDQDTQTARPSVLAKAAAEDLRATQGGAYIYPVVSDILQYSRYTDSERAVIEMYKNDYVDPALAALQFTFDENTQSYHVTGYNDTMADIVIPALYRGYPVTKIGDAAFKNNTALKSITLPASITAIGGSAFSGCDNLTSVFVSDLTSWLGISFGSNTANPLFYYDYSTTALPRTLYVNGEALGGTVVIPAEITQIPVGAFYDQAVSEIRLHAGVTDIASYAFKFCTALSNINLAEATSLQSIGYEAFSTCTSLTDVSLPASVQTLGDSVFISCSSIESFTLPKESALTAISGYAFRDCTALHTVVIEADILSIGQQAFRRCTALATLTLPASLTTVGDLAFDSTLNIRVLKAPTVALSAMSLPILQSLTVNAGTSLSTTAMNDATCLEQVFFECDITSIGSAVFKGCIALKEISLPATLVSLGSTAFKGCTSLVTINLPEGLQSIGSECFMECTSLQSIEIPATITSWATSAFYSCSSLATVTFAEGFAHTELPAYTFKNCVALDGIILPASITTIGKDALRNCTSLTAITIPDAVTSIGANLLTGNTALVEMTLPFVGANFGGTTNTHIGYLFGASSYSANVSTVPASLTKLTVTQQCVFGATDFSGIELELVLHHIWGSEWVYDAVSHWHPCARPGCTAASEAKTHGYNKDNVCTGCSYSINLSNLKLQFDAATSSYTVTGYTGSPTDIVIPAVYNGYPITAIAASAFKSCTTLTSVSIGSNVNTIGKDAFEDCTALRNVHMATGVESIGAECFHNCTSLLSVNIPATVATLGESVFHTCSALKEVTFAATTKLTAIPNYTFRYCAALTTLVLPEGITSIGYVSLANCSSLMTLSLPSTMTTIDAEAFLNSTVIQNVTMPTAVISAMTGFPLKRVVINGGTEIPNMAFSAITTLQSVTIGSGITTIGYQAFKECTNLSEILLPEGLVTMGNECFYGCSPVAVTIPASVTTWGTSIFYNCHTLETVTFAEGSQLTSISGWAFRACYALRSINIPTTITSIGSHAFWNCYSLDAITIPSTVKTIGENAFVYTGISAVTLPTGLTSLGAGAFEHCHNLTTIKIPSGVTVIGDKTFRYCTSLSAVTFASYTKATAIGARAFEYCVSLTSFRFPTTVTSVGESAFYWCRSLTKVIATNTTNWSKINFGNSDANPLSNGATLYSNASATTKVTTISLNTAVTAIGSYAFYNCDTLTTITATANLAEIGKGAFARCDALTTINIPTLETWFGISFADAKSNPLAFGARLYVKNGTTYEEVSGEITVPATVTEVSPFAFYGCDWLTGVNVTDLAAFAQIDFGNFYANPLYYAKKLYLNGTEVTALVLPEGISKIGDHAFVNGAFAAVTLPEGVTSIGKNAFNGAAMTAFDGAADTLYYSSFAYCNSLTNFTVSADMIRYLPKNAVKTVVISGGTSIPAEAFKGCTKLTSVTIPASITHIGVDAFSGCTALTNVYITDVAAWCAIDFDSYTANPLHKAQNLYLDGSKVTSVSIPSGVTEIAPFAFYGFKGITAVTIPASVTVIDSYAFTNCTALATVTFSGTGLTDIQSYAFSGCTALKSFAIPSTVKSIAPYAFSGSGLTTLTGTTTGFRRYNTVSATSGTSATLTATYLKSTYTAYWWKK